jgi:hypothetical protein
MIRPYIRCYLNCKGLLCGTKWFGQIGTIFQSPLAGYQCSNKKIVKRNKVWLENGQLDKLSELSKGVSAAQGVYIIR